ncbi:MAG: hypothetical protein K5648_02475 [Erysipelotrichaceae bacterium]|nr:hypothetical protein [Erysipelotrichaceae bacterium]
MNRMIGLLLMIGLFSAVRTFFLTDGHLFGNYILLFLAFLVGVGYVVKLRK